MKDQFVTYEIAKKLKDLGFNESCLATYIEPAKLVCAGQYDKLTPKEKELLFSNNYPFCNSENTTTAPMWQQANDWLFKQYNIFIEIKRIKVMADPEDDLYVYYCEIGDFSSEHYKMPKQALRKGIEEALKLIKDK